MVAAYYTHLADQVTFSLFHINLNQMAKTEVSILIKIIEYCCLTCQYTEFSYDTRAQVHMSLSYP